MGQSAPGTPGTPGPKGDKGDKGDKGEQGETQLDTSNMSALSDRIVKNKYLYTGITSNLTDNDKYVSQLSAAFSDNQLRKISDAMVQPDTKLLNNLSDKLIQDYYQKLPQAQITDGDVNTKIKPKTLWCADGEICTLPKSVQRSYFTGDVVINPGAKFLFGIDNGAKGAPDVKTGVLEWASNDNNWTYGPFMYGKDGGQLGVRDHQGNTIGATLTWGPDNVTINHGDLTVGDGTRGNIIMRGSEFKIHNGIAGLGTGGTAISMDAAETLVLNEFGHFDNGVRISGRLETDRDVRIGSIGSGGNLYVGSFGGGGGSITQYGPDFKISYKGRGSGGRALVHEEGNKLVLNYNGDFTGGTLIGGPKLAIDGDVEFGKGIQVAGDNISFKVGNVSKRALYADSGDRLTINRNNEFAGGTLVEGPKLSVLNNLEVGNTDSSTNSGGNIALYGNKIEFKQGTPGNGGIALFADPQSDTLTISKGDSFVGGTVVDGPLSVSKNATFTGDMTVSGGVTVGSMNVGGNMEMKGVDFRISNTARGSGGRALVHEAGNRLILNYNGDFTGGTEIQSEVRIPGRGLKIGDWKISQGSSGNLVITNSAGNIVNEIKGDGDIWSKKLGRSVDTIGAWMSEGIHTNMIAIAADDNKAWKLLKDTNDLQFDKEGTGARLKVHKEGGTTGSLSVIGGDFNLPGGWKITSISNGADFKIYRTSRTDANLVLNGGGNNDVSLGGKLYVRNIDASNDVKGKYVYVDNIKLKDSDGNLDLMDGRYKFTKSGNAKFVNGNWWLEANNEWYRFYRDNEGDAFIIKNDGNLWRKRTGSRPGWISENQGGPGSWWLDT